MLGNNTGNKLCRCHVKRRVKHCYALRRSLLAAEMTYLVGLALLNRNLRTCSNGKIKGTRRRGDIKRNPMCLRRQCYAIGADLVRRVAVGRNSVGTFVHMVHAAILSVISVTGMPSSNSSNAVKRAPCKSGRVSSA